MTSTDLTKEQAKQMDLFNDDQRIPVVDGGIAYVLRNGRPELEHRLAEVFRIAWGMLPPEATRQIERHWQDRQRFAERILIKELGFSYIGDPVLAVTLLEGHRIEFDGRGVQYLPERLLVGVTVHELAHVYAYAMGDEPHKAEFASEEERNQAEPVVERLLAAWDLCEHDKETARWIWENREGWGID